MVKTLGRLALVWILTMILAPRLARLFETLSTRVPQDSFFRDVLDEMSERYSSSLVHALALSVTEVLVGSGSSKR